jgi:hypothetical protein
MCREPGFEIAADPTLGSPSFHRSGRFSTCRCALFLVKRQAARRASPILQAYAHVAASFGPGSGVPFKRRVSVAGPRYI